MTRFITSNKQIKEPEALQQMKKYPTETLRQYSDRYWQLFNEIPGVDPDWAANMFKNGLETGSALLLELAIRPPDDMDVLMETIEKFCLLEELYAEREKQGIPTPANALTVAVPASISAQKSQPTQPAARRQVNTVKSNARRVPKAHDYVAETTVFTEPIYVLLQKIQRLPFFRWPEGKLGTDTRDPG